MHRLSHRVARLSSLLSQTQHLPCSLGGVEWGRSLETRGEEERDRWKGEEVERERELYLLGRVFHLAGNAAIEPAKRSIHLTFNSTSPLYPSLFHQAFGGSLISWPGKGASRPSYRWKIFGRNARNTARIIGKVEGRKERLLRLISEIDEELRKDRVEIEKLKANLDSLRSDLSEKFNEGGRVRSWKDFVELIDSKGVVVCIRETNVIRLCVMHKNPSLLASISSFLQEEGVDTRLLPSVRLTKAFEKSPPTFAWNCRSRILASFLLQKCLDLGLVLQKRKVEKALKILESRVYSPLNPANCRRRYLQLSEEEASVSQILKKMRDLKKVLLSRSPKGEEKKRKVLDIDEKIAVLKKTREESKPKTREKMLHNDIRNLLSNGWM